MRVGVVAIQGDFEKHIESLRRTEIEGVQTEYVRSPQDLARVERVILPGGESTTVGLLMSRFGLGDALIEAGREGMPMWGTCMGMIMLAREIEGREQYRLGLLDIAVRRNAFGAQVHSFEAPISVSLFAEPVTAVFIRAPIVTHLGEGVEPIAEIDGQCVAVRQGAIVGTSFHPELTDDVRMHRWFVSS